VLFFARACAQAKALAGPAPLPPQIYLRGEHEMNRHFTFKDYANDLKYAGPKTTENLLDRAAEDRDISFEDFVKLEDLADEIERSKQK